MATKLHGQIETLCCGSLGYVAPEVINKEGYGLKADIFSCGIIMYMLIIGISPFSASTADIVTKKNKLCEIKYCLDEWKLVSKEALDLVIKMTDKDQYQRLSVQQCLKHEWFKLSELKSPLKHTWKNIKKYGE